MYDIVREYDLPEINRILNIPSVHKYFNFHPPLPMEATRKWYDEVINNRKSGIGDCVVAREGNKVIGWNYVFENNEPERNIVQFLKNYQGRKGYLAAIVVNPESAGKGTGQSLLHKGDLILKKAGLKGIWLGTNSDNLHAKHLYERDGYKLIGKLERYKVRSDGKVVDQMIYFKQF